ncbi:hypothetical protein [Chitinophaga sp. RAB17]|uniref:hypothetical protein n=1 Tax=Chitinophaga sp. RAB17 TaxID=3233049 RepID=UPI003F8E293D
MLRKGIAAGSICSDNTSFGGKLADVVVKKAGNSYDIYEIKTDTDLRRGLREAVGQLIYYAVWEKEIKISRLYVVLPFVKLSTGMQQYVLRVSKALNLSLEVMLYDRDRQLFISVK